MTAAAFQATYSDWKVIKGRKVVQVVFELPLELSDQAYQALGGMPVAAHEVWCGIARMNPKGGDETESQHSCGSSTPETQPRSSAAQKAGADKPKKTPAQVAGYLCTVPAFQRFLADKYPHAWGPASWKFDGADVAESEIAAEAVRQLCKVESRSDLSDKNTEWTSLRLAYQLWLNEPDLEIAS